MLWVLICKLSVFVDLYETIILLGLISQSCDFYILQTWRICSLSSSGNPNQIVVMGKSIWYYNIEIVPNT